MALNEQQTETEPHGREVAVLGLGLMGSALARAFLDAGHRVTVWNRSGDRCAPLQSLGAAVAPSVAEAVGSASVIVICLANYRAGFEVFDRAACRNLRNRAVVQLTTGSPEDARRFERWARSHGAACLEGAVTSWPREIGTDEGLISYSGDSRLFDSLLPTLTALSGTPVFLGDDIARAAIHDLVGQAGYYVAAYGILQSIALGTRLGLSATEAADLVRGMLPMADAGGAACAAVVDEASYRSPGRNRARLDAHARMVALIERTVAETGNATDLVTALAQVTDRAVRAGWGGGDFAALVEGFWGAGAEEAEPPSAE